MSSQDRNCYATNLSAKIKIELTSKQFLVYLHMLSKSKWNPKGEKHYYLYKNEVHPYQLCEEVGLSPITYTNGIKKLIETGFIKEFDDYYIISFTSHYVSLPPKTIVGLINWGSKTKFGGYLCSIYCGLYKYFYYCKDNSFNTNISLNTLKTVYFRTTSRSSNSKELYLISQILSTLQFLGLIEYQTCGEKYFITNVTKIINEEHSDYDREEIEKFLTALEL